MASVYILSNNNKSLSYVLANVLIWNLMFINNDFYSFEKMNWIPI